MDMGFFARWFGFLKGLQAPESTEVKPILLSNRVSAAIAYDAQLIDRLKAEHETLVEVFSGIQTAAEVGNLFKLSELLESFHATLQEHLMHENVKFYTYLKQQLKKDKQALESIIQIKREMDDAARTAIRFILTYAGGKLSADQLADFKHELGIIGDMLTKRVTLEETKLYPLYRPSRQHRSSRVAG